VGDRPDAGRCRNSGGRLSLVVLVDPLLARVVVLLVVVVAVAATGLAWRARERRRRRSRPVPVGSGVLLPTAGLDVPPGDEATVVVVGTRGCSDCARTLAALRAGLADRPGTAVAHVLAERVPDLVGAVGIRTAPTVLLADAAGRVVATHPGPVDVDVVVGALDALAAGAAPSLTPSRRTA
jgi:hypothetical protein